MYKITSIETDQSTTIFIWHLTQLSTMAKITLITLVFVLILLTGCATEEVDITETNETYSYEIVHEGLNSPWGMEFLSEDQMLITENNGNLILLDLNDLESQEIAGLPDISTPGQGGLLDVHFDEGYVYLTYSGTDDDGDYATHLGRGELNQDDNSLDDFEVLHIATPFMSGGNHFGSRVLTHGDYLFYSTGDRGRKDFDSDHVSQDTENFLGTIIRLYKDGSIPDDNPFVDDDEVLDEIYTYGHRNVQGLSIHPETGELWASEHGERDGDKINIIRAGRNYGWPIAHSGCRYGTDVPVGESEFEMDDVEDPAYVWECGTGGFPPAGMTFYKGDTLERFDGDLFVGNLAGQELGRFLVDEEVNQTEPLLTDLGERIRDVAQGPDGYLYAISDGGLLIRIE